MHHVIQRLPVKPTEGRFRRLPLDQLRFSGYRHRCQRCPVGNRGRINIGQQLGIGRAMGPCMGQLGCQRGKQRRLALIMAAGFQIIIMFSGHGTPSVRQQV